MKKTTLSIVSILALSGLAFAGGDIAPIIEEEPIVVVERSPLYLGLGIGSFNFNNDFTGEEISSTTLMLQAGYKYNEYVALEGRYTFGFSTDYERGNLPNNALGGYDGDTANWGIYVKPMYPIGDFSLYALLGYGGVMLNDLAGGDAYESGFQWGLGADYAVSENVSVFVDYVALYDDTGFDYRAQLDDIDVDTWTVGVSYRF